jgi:hypothetical protein
MVPKNTVLYSTESGLPRRGNYILTTKPTKPQNCVFSLRILTDFFLLVIEVQRVLQEEVIHAELRSWYSSKCPERIYQSDWIFPKLQGTS